MKCNSYNDRPHSCRLCPFQYNEEKKVGYIASEVSVCPGFYLADAVDESALETWRTVAAESKEGIAFYDEKVGELMKTVGGLIGLIKGQSGKDNPNALGSIK